MTGEWWEYMFVFWSGVILGGVGKWVIAMRRETIRIIGRIIKGGKE
jgi:hypothetical protein